MADYINEFVSQLDSKNNRLHRGAMTAFVILTNERPKEIYAAFRIILSVADNGSVITKDHAVSILIKLCSIENHSDVAFALLVEQVIKKFKCQKTATH